MKAFRLLSSTALVTLAAFAQEGATVSFDVHHISKPITPAEILALVAFIALVGGGVFLLIRRRPKDDAAISLTSRHIE